MSEEEASAALYKDGEIVWVKLGPSWWPGEVKDLGSLPEDVATFKKPPLVVVKFFDEDLYEYVRSWSNIHPYNCEKKNEFIRKGLAAYRAKAPHMEKFPKDVTTAEVKIDGNPNILSDAEFIPKKKNLNDLFQTQSPKMKKSKDKYKTKSPTKDTAHITHRRFLGADSLNDYRAYICIQYPGKDRKPGDPEDDEIIRINTEPEPEEEYKCCTCTFTTKRLEVMIMHRKSHIQGVYVSTTPRKYKSPLIKRQKKDRPKVKGPEAKKKKVLLVQTPEKSDKVSRPLTPSEETKPKESKKLTSELLAEWDDDDDEEGENIDQSIEGETVVPYSPCEATKKAEDSGETDLQVSGSGTISSINAKKGQKKDEVVEHSKIDVEPEHGTKDYDQERVDHEITDTNECEQKEQTKENATGEAVSPEKKESKAPEKEPGRVSRWDSRIIHKRASKGSEKQVSKKSENSKEDNINLGCKESEPFTKGEQKSSEEELHRSTKKDYDEETSSLPKTFREKYSKSPEMKKSSTIENKASKSSVREFDRSVEEKPNIAHSKYEKTVSKKRTSSTEDESIRKDLKTSNDNDTKICTTDPKVKEYSKTSEKRDIKCNVRESKSSRRRESRSTVEKGSATDSKTLWKKDTSSDNKDSRSPEEGSKIIRSTEKTEEKEARSYGVDSKSRWRRKTPEKASKVSERRNDEKDQENSDFDPNILWELDSGNTGSGSLERESKTPLRRDSKYCDETSYKSPWKRDSGGLEKQEGKGTKALESHDTKNPESQVDKDIKSCFDFDEEEEEEPVISAAPAGRKIPRVIPERRKSTAVEQVEDIPNTSHVLKDSHSMESNIARENFADDNLENTFKELMETTKVPNLPDIQNTLKCEQNFHNIKTIKFPDKALGEPSPPKEEVATKLTNPKKRFVKSFEDFEMMQNNIKKKEEGGDIQEKMQQKEGEPENELNKSINETINVEDNQPQKEEERVHVLEKCSYDVETCKETMDVQKATQEKTSHRIEPPAHLKEEKIQQLEEQMMNQPNMIDKQHLAEDIIIEGIQGKLPDMNSSEEKLEATEKTVRPQQQSDDNNEINNDSKISKSVLEKLRIVKPKAKLITPFKIQRETNKQHSTLPKTISMKDVITNMTEETEPPVDLENKVHFANLKSKIMSKIIEDSKLSNASKDKIMSLMESEKDSETENQDESEATRTTRTISSKRCHKTPRTKILESYMEDQKKSHTSDTVFQQHPSIASTEENITLSEEATPIARKRAGTLEKKAPVNQEKKGRWSRRGSHPKKDRTFMEETESFPEEPQICLPQEASKCLSEEPSISQPSELPLSNQSTVALCEEPEKPNIVDVSKGIVLDEIPLPEEIAVEDIPLPPEPAAPEKIPLGNIPSGTEDLEKSEQPLLNSTEKETLTLPAQLNRTEELVAMDSQDTTKPLIINLDNDHSDNIFTSQSFLSSSMDFSPIGTASASLPDNAICLPPKKSKKRKYPCTDDEGDSGSSKRISTDSQQPLNNEINWSTMNKAESIANAPKQESNYSQVDKSNIYPNYPAEGDVNWAASKEGLVTQPQASTNNEADVNVRSQSPGEVEENRCNTAKKAKIRIPQWNILRNN
ncbi:unnamed protein product [Callosobruchus maculatus]|uniref:PWWP domain-containing protein n=1 Tax=Callosobruchus maculatus TaxID=64391 RepID=A0A653CIF2_CALMS|nr:unnamed protein product [Callosobruchus maculatus]